MAFTFATLVDDEPYTTRLTVRDYNGDRVRKVNRLLNLTDVGGAAESSLQLFYRAYETIQSAALDNPSAAQEVEITGAKSTTADGNNAKVSDRLVLWFSKEHPLNPAKVVWASFIIVAPVDAIIGTGGAAGEPVFTPDVTLADAATDPERLGAMIDYLEDAITYLAVDGNYYNGGWDYSAQYSRLVSVTKDVGGNPDT